MCALLMPDIFIGVSWEIGIRDQLNMVVSLPRPSVEEIRKVTGMFSGCYCNACIRFVAWGDYFAEASRLTSVNTHLLFVLL
jgi:hypothetical protein